MKCYRLLLTLQSQMSPLLYHTVQYKFDDNKSSNYLVGVIPLNITNVSNSSNEPFNANYATKGQRRAALTLLSYLCYSVLPALNDLTLSKLELKGLVPVSGGVKLLPVLQHTCQRETTLTKFRE